MLLSVTSSITIRAKPKSFSVGQLVYYFNPRKHVGRSDKWQRKYTGPFRVEKVLSPVNVLLRKSNKSKPFVAHIDKVKKCYEDPAGSDTVEKQSNPQAAVYAGVSSDPVCVDNERDESFGRPKRRAEPPRRLIDEC